MSSARSSWRWNWTVLVTRCGLWTSCWSILRQGKLTDALITLTVVVVWVGKRLFGCWSAGCAWLAQTPGVGTRHFRLRANGSLKLAILRSSGKDTRRVGTL